MPLLNKPELIRIPLPAEGEWVDVKDRLSAGDFAHVQKAAVKNAKINGDYFEINAADAIDSATFSVMEVAIVKWSFNEPVTADNLRALDQDSVDCIRERLNEIYPSARTEAEKKGSSETTDSPSSTESLHLLS